MPKDNATAKRKAADPPAPLHDSSTRGFLSTRTTSSIVTASNITTRRYAAQSQIIPTLPRPLFGDFDEAMYARPTDQDDDQVPDSTIDVNDGSPAADVVDGRLPGIVVKTKVVKRYANSVCLSMSSLTHKCTYTFVLGYPARYVGSAPR